MSKGSRQRPIKDKKQYDKNWEQIFSKDTNNSADDEFGFIYGDYPGHVKKKNQKRKQNEQ